MIYSVTARRVLLGSGTSALIGASMWAYKSVAIVVSGRQPEYWFELALGWFGLSTLLLATALRQHVSRSRLVTSLGWISAVAGIGASVVYWLDGNDEGMFGPAAMAMMLATIVFFFLVGGEVHKARLFGRFDFAPRLLGWLYVGAIPVGAVLSALFGERFLEVGLLGVVTGWVALALGALRASNSRPLDPTALPGRSNLSDPA